MATSGYYTYSVSSGEATITDCNESISGDVTIPDTLGGYYVTNIGDNAFDSCYSLTSITIPGRVKGIGKKAFYYCYRLTSITIPGSVTNIGGDAFKGCTSINKVTITDLKSWCHIDFAGSTSNPIYCSEQSVELYVNNILIEDTMTIPNDTEYIAAYAFRNYKKITEVKIPNSVTLIGKHAFDDCANLTKITLPFIGMERAAVNGYPDGYPRSHFGFIFGATYPEHSTSNSTNNTKVPSKLTTVIINDKDSSNSDTSSIDSSAFEDCTSLTSVTIGNSVTSIDNEAFYNCKNLTDVTTGDGVTYIGEYAFQNCTNLTNITIGSSVSSIDQDAFDACKKLARVNITNIAAWCEIDFFGSTSNPLFYAGDLYLDDKCVTNLVIPGSVAYIRSYVFWGCTSLESISIPNSVEFIGNEVFFNCSSLTSITIPNSVISMGNYIFYNCTSLASATIGNDIRKIDSAAFCNCTSLTEIKIGNSVTSIGDYAFYNCTSLTSITIPSNVTSIGYYAFRYCENLESITLPFVGNALNGTSNTHFGYIFGASSYSYNNDYIPTSLKEVIITKSNNIGNYTFYQCTNLETIIIPNTVTSIGNEAFYNCTNLTSVTIPNSVTSIGENAFSAESNISPLITNLYINDIIQWYKINFANETANPMWRTTNVYYKDSDDNYSLLKNLVIPNDIGEKIKQYTFINYDFTSITISDNTEISINAFSNGSCKKLIFADNSKNLYCNFIGSDGSISTKILFEKSVEEIIIPFSITNIRVSDLNNCIKLKNIIVDSKNEKYSSEDGVLFYNGNVGLELVRYPICNEMINYNIPNGVVVIGNSAFESCKSLKSVTIPNSVVNILSNAFRYCYLLKSIDIPKKVKYIYNYTFQGCEELKEITITNNIISIAEYAFDGCESLSIVYYKGKKDDIIFNEDNITIGKKIITIGEYNNALKLANWVFIPTLNGFIITEGNERKNIIEAYVIAIDNDTKILKPINNVLLK